MVPTVCYSRIHVVRQICVMSFFALIFTALACAPLMAAPMATTPYFVENNGQWHSDVRYCARMPNLTVWVTETGIIYDHYRPQSIKPQRDTAANNYTGHVVQMRFAHAQTSAVTGKEQLDAVSHFLNTSTHKPVHAMHYNSVVLRGVYKGIDVLLSFEKGQLRYDFAIAPHSSPEQITLQYQGCPSNALHISPSGELSLALNTGTVQHGRLFAYQTIHNTIVQIPCRFVQQADSSVGFALGAYNPALPLVIDPLVYASYLGGTANDIPQDIATDSHGNIYIAGYTFSTNYPTTLGAYKQTIASSPDSSDVFLTKLNATGTSIIYSTYLGGIRNDIATALAVLPNGEVFLTGRTNSPDFPVTPNALDASYNGFYDVFLARISARGDSLLYATYLGGNSNESAYDIALHNDTLYLTGFTDSDRKFPVTTNALQSQRASAQDAFLLVLNGEGNSLLYGSYFGGNSSDIANSIAIGDDGTTYIAGRTTSTDLPITAIAIKKNLSGPGESADAFIAAFHPTDKTITYCSYFGGSGTDEQIESIAINSKGQLVIGGWSNSSDLPITDGVFGPSPSPALYNSGFIGALGFTEEDPVFLSYLGGNDQGSTTVLDIAIDPDDNVFCTGTTFNRSFPVTPDAFDPTYDIPSNGEAFITLVRSNATALVYSSYFGGDQLDIGTAVVAGKYNTAIVAGQTRSSNLPTTPPLGRSFSGALDGFVASFSTGLVLRSPLGGDTVCVGTLLPITWEASQRVTSVTISLLDDTDTELLLADNVRARDKQWLWSVPSDFLGGRIYRIRIRNTADSSILAESDTVLSIFSRPVFTVQPTGVQSCPGGTVELTCQTKVFPDPFYQWQILDNGTWVDIPGASLRLYTVFGVSPQNQGQYRAKVWTLCGDTSYSSIATIEVLSVPAIKVQPLSTSVCIGATAQFYAHSSDTYASIQWQQKIPEVGAAWQDIPNATSEELRLPNVQPKHNGTTFRAVFTSTCATITLPVVLIVSSAPTLSSHPTAQTVCVGASAAFGVSTLLKDATFQWQRSDDDTQSWQNIPDAITPTYSLAAVSRTDEGAWFRVIVQGPCSAVQTISQAAQLHITPFPLVTTATSTVNFGVLGLCSTDSTVVLTLVNTGSETIPIGTPTIENSNFSVLAFPSQLPPGTSATLSLRFAPVQIPADEEATLSIPVGLCGDDIGIVLIGKKAQASVASSVTSVDFGTIASCTTTPIDTLITMSNTGLLPITIHAAIVQPPLSVTPNGIFPIVLGPAQSVQFRLRFTPTTNGIHTGMVALPFTTGALCKDTLRISTRGQRDTPALAVQPAIQFPVHPLCVTQADTIVYLHNTGTLPIVLGTQTPIVSGTAFAVAFPSTATVLESGDSLAIGVSFFPQQLGTYRDSLVFALSPCGTTYTIVFSGEAVQPRITTNTAAAVFTQTTRSHTISIINNNELPITIAAVTASDARSFSVQTSELLPYILLPNRSLQATVIYTTTGVATSATLTILSTVPCPLSAEVQLDAQDTAPLQASLRVPSLQQHLGDTFILPILADTTQLAELLRAGAVSFRCQLSFNATMMTPTDPTQRGTIANGNHIMHIQGMLANRHGDTLWSTTMLAGLGNSSHTPIILSSVLWLTAQDIPIAVATTQQDGELHITNIKKGQHLNPGAAPFSLDIYPIPATKSVSVSLHNLPSLATAVLGVYDSFGRKVADWTPDLSLLTGTPTTGYNGTVAFDITHIPAGVYYCQMSIGNAVLVRSFIVY